MCLLYVVKPITVCVFYIHLGIFFPLHRNSSYHNLWLYRCLTTVMLYIVLFLPLVSLPWFSVFKIPVCVSPIASASLITSLRFLLSPRGYICRKDGNSMCAVSCLRYSLLVVRHIFTISYSLTFHITLLTLCQLGLNLSSPFLLIAPLNSNRLFLILRHVTTIPFLLLYDS